MIRSEFIANMELAPRQDNRAAFVTVTDRTPVAIAFRDSRSPETREFERHYARGLAQGHARFIGR